MDFRSDLQLRALKDFCSAVITTHTTLLRTMRYEDAPLRTNLLRNTSISWRGSYKYMSLLHLQRTGTPSEESSLKVMSLRLRPLQPSPFAFLFLAVSRRPPFLGCPNSSCSESIEVPTDGDDRVGDREKKGRDPIFSVSWLSVKKFVGKVKRFG